MFFKGGGVFEYDLAVVFFHYFKPVGADLFIGRDKKIVKGCKGFTVISGILHISPCAYGFALFKSGAETEGVPVENVLVTAVKAVPLFQLEALKQLLDAPSEILIHLYCQGVFVTYSVKAHGYFGFFAVVFVAIIKPRVHIGTMTAKMHLFQFPHSLFSPFFHYNITPIACQHSSMVRLWAEVSGIFLHRFGRLWQISCA